MFSSSLYCNGLRLCFGYNLYVKQEIDYNKLAGLTAGDVESV